MGLDYVDIFYSHRFDPDTPLEETMGALDTAVRQGKALYVGISSYSPDRTREAATILERLGTPLLIHQPSYSMLNRWIEDGLLDTLGELGVGCIGFSPLAQGLLTDRYADGIPEGLAGSTADLSLDAAQLTDQTVAKVRGLREIAAQRGQSLAAMALAWTLRDARMTSTLVGASSVEQLEANVKALDRLDFTRRRAGRDRPLRDRERHQPLGDLERALGPRPPERAAEQLLEPPIRLREGPGERRTRVGRHRRVLPLEDPGIRLELVGCGAEEARGSRRTSRRDAPRDPRCGRRAAAPARTPRATARAARRTGPAPRTCGPTRRG